MLLSGLCKLHWPHKELWLCKDLHNGFCLPLGNRFQKQDNQHQSYSLVLQQLVQELIFERERNNWKASSNLSNYCYLTWSTAFNIRISCVAWSASANASMIAGFTISIGCTVTGINTFLIATGKSCGALWICQAFIGSTFYIRTSFVSWWTLTLRSMSVHSTESFDATLFIGTRILTFSLDASLSERTLIITLTTS